MRSPVVIALLAGAAQAVPHPPEGQGEEAHGDEPEEPAKCAKCPLHNHQAAHPPPSGDSLGSLLGGGPPPILPYGAEAPVGNVDISTNQLLRDRMEVNIDYLLTSFDVDHLLAPFRQRAGNASATWGARPPAGFWDSDLLGSNAGRFLMGAGNTLRWIEHPALRQMLDDVVDGVEQCRNASGYILAYEPAGFMHSEQGDYGRSWFTQGLIEAGKAGNPKAFPLLRGMCECSRPLAIQSLPPEPHKKSICADDWFDNPDLNPYQPYLYDGIGNGEQGQIASTRVYLETPIGVWSDMQVAQDIYRDNEWMEQLIARDSTGISAYHMPTPNHPHCYEITSFLSMFDHYRATGNSTWLHAAQGAWDIITSDFLHIDGSSALTEGAPDHGTDWKKKTYRIQPGTGTGETCCTTFWIKFVRRLSIHPHRRSSADHRVVARRTSDSACSTPRRRSTLPRSRRRSTMRCSRTW